jgi:hypothetical protein
MLQFERFQHNKCRLTSGSGSVSVFAPTRSGEKRGFVKALVSVGFLQR